MGITRSDMQLCVEKLEEKLSLAQHVILEDFAVLQPLWQQKRVQM